MEILDIIKIDKTTNYKEDGWLIPKIEKIMISPSLGEKENEVEEIAEEIIDKITSFND
ncbi:hypothetical protein QE422_000570 [Chryseobacterium sp. SORGH_AS 447]|uniref:hypothetical protein n=1 Tax=Chryseobacterium sp. SORGH_AS_0447 TaxID=3041769 RepID=UPI002789494F|nr:hypothetical protein [Chryseobacterium sp. SORGH_AS_0447]MDQ1160202.1 hypothetical protein [Chryseobacterium sp. SORGH_AS_0447]